MPTCDTAGIALRISAASSGGLYRCFCASIRMKIKLWHYTGGTVFMPFPHVTLFCESRCTFEFIKGQTDSSFLYCWELVFKPTIDARLLGQFFFVFSLVAGSSFPFPCRSNPKIRAAFRERQTLVVVSLQLSLFPVVSPPSPPQNVS